MKDRYKVFNLITLAGAKVSDKTKNISFNYAAKWDTITFETDKKQKTDLSYKPIK